MRQSPVRLNQGQRWWPSAGVVAAATALLLVACGGSTTSATIEASTTTGASEQRSTATTAVAGNNTATTAPPASSSSTAAPATAPTTTAAPRPAQLTEDDLARVVIGDKAYDLCAIAQPIAIATAPSLQRARALAPYEVLAAAQAAGSHTITGQLETSRFQAEGAIRCQLSSTDPGSPGGINIDVVTDAMLQLSTGDPGATATSRATARHDRAESPLETPGFGQRAWTLPGSWAVVDEHVFLVASGAIGSDREAVVTIGQRVFAALKSAVDSGSGVKFSLPAARTAPSVVTVTGPTGTVNLCTYAAQIGQQVLNAAGDVPFGVTTTFKIAPDNGAEIDVSYASCNNEPADRDVVTGRTAAEVTVFKVEPTLVQAFLDFWFDGSGLRPAPDLGPNALAADVRAVVSAGDLIVSVTAGDVLAEEAERQPLAGQVAATIAKALGG